MIPRYQSATIVQWRSWEFANTVLLIERDWSFMFSFAGGDAIAGREFRRRVARNSHRTGIDNHPLYSMAQRSNKARGRTKKTDLLSRTHGVGRRRVSPERSSREV